MRARLLAVGAAAASLLMCLPPPARAAESAVIVEGEGAGHGVGMAQDGALAMGRAGADTAEILQAFYPGTRPGTAGGTLAVRVLEGHDTNVTVAFPQGGRISARSPAQPPGFPISMPAGSQAVLTRAADGLRVRASVPISPIAAVEAPTSTAAASSSSTPTPSTAEAPTTSTAAASTSTSTSTTTKLPATTAPAKVAAPQAPAPANARVAPPAAPAANPAPAPAPNTPSLERDATSPAGLRLEPAEGSTVAVQSRGRSYRGVLDVDAASEGGIALVNRLDVEQYLKGMGEVLDPSWPAAALRAQAIAARTYALRAVRSGSEICDDDRCQVYLGAQVEYDAMNQAVDDTAGQVLTYGSGLASTVYSSSAGGITATPAEGFGTSDDAYPYLVSKRYEAPAEIHWTMAFAPADVARRLHYPGNVERIEVAQAGPSGRPIELSMIGDAGVVKAHGTAVVTGLGLPSSLFRISNGDAPPQAIAASSPAPPAQVAPDDVIRVVGAPFAATLTPRTRPKRPSDAAHAVVSELALLVAGALAVVDRRRRKSPARQGSATLQPAFTTPSPNGHTLLEGSLASTDDDARADGRRDRRPPVSLLHSLHRCGSTLLGRVRRGDAGGAGAPVEAPAAADRADPAYDVPAGRSAARRVRAVLRSGRGARRRG